MKLTYHCITKPDEWEIQVTEGGKPAKVPQIAKDFRTRERERAVEWLIAKILDDDEDDLYEASFEAEDMIQNAELELAQRIWKKADDENREAWCEMVEVETPSSSQKLKDLPMLVEEMLGLEDQ